MNEARRRGGALKYKFETSVLGLQRVFPADELVLIFIICFRNISMSRSIVRYFAFIVYTTFRINDVWKSNKFFGSVDGRCSVFLAHSRLVVINFFSLRSVVSGAFFKHRSSRIISFRSFHSEKKTPDMVKSFTTNFIACYLTSLLKK